MGGDPADDGDRPTPFGPKAPGPTEPIPIPPEDPPN